MGSIIRTMAWTRGEDDVLITRKSLKSRKWGKKKVKRSEICSIFVRFALHHKDGPMCLKLCQAFMRPDYPCSKIVKKQMYLLPLAAFSNIHVFQNFVCRIVFRNHSLQFWILLWKIIVFNFEYCLTKSWFSVLSIVLRNHSFQFWILF